MPETQSHQEFTLSSLLRLGLLFGQGGLQLKNHMPELHESWDFTSIQSEELPFNTVTVLNTWVTFKAYYFSKKTKIYTLLLKYVLAK